MDSIFGPHGLVQGFENMSQNARETFVEGPQIIILASHNGTDLEYLHQMTCADGIIHPSRYQQMREQAESNHRRLLIEFPRNALLEASPTFKHYLETHPDTMKIPLDMDHILPGYAVEVMDWYRKALTVTKWFDFPIKVSNEGSNNWYYYYYIYVAMRLLGMDAFAKNLQGFLEDRIDANHLANDYGSYIHILRHLPEHDPVVAHLATKCASLISSGKVSMSPGSFEKIKSKFPYFGPMVDRFTRMNVEGVFQLDDMAGCLSGARVDGPSEVDRLSNDMGQLHVTQESDLSGIH